jgi:hypothetical protein
MDGCTGWEVVASGIRYNGNGTLQGLTDQDQMAWGLAFCGWDTLFVKSYLESAA